MTTALLADILAALLRIEAKLDTAKVADTATDTATAKYYREMAERHKTVPADRPPITPSFIAIPGMPDPPIAPVRPQTVWGVNKANAPSLNQGRFMHGGWIHATGFSMVGP